MSNDDQISRNLTKQTLVVFFITATALFVIGNLALALAPSIIGPVSLRPEVLAQFIIPSNVSPKPFQRFVFLCVIFSVLPVLALVTYLVRRFSTPIAFSAFRSPLGEIREPRFQKSSQSSGVSRAVQGLVIGLVLIFAIYAGGYFRWFGANEVDYKFIDPVSLDAVIFSIVRIAQGGTCLVDVTPLYGCYGEYFKPLWSFVTPSVKAITTVFFFLYLVSVFSAMRFASRIIREPAVLLICGITLVIIGSFYGFFDPDFQYWPLRTIFPCLALGLAPVWLDGPSARKAFGLGVFSALAISWNLDSGIPVFLSIAILIILTGCTSVSALHSLFSRRRFIHLGTYGTGVVATLLSLLGYLSLKAGALADPGLYIRFQRIFYFAGYLMIPTPHLPHPWGVVVTAIVLGLAALAVRALRGRPDGQYELIGYAAILAVGLFVYYTGRSHDRVLETVSWLPAILAFCLADIMITDLAGKAKYNVSRLVWVGVALLVAASWSGFYRKGMDERWSDQLGMSANAAPLVEDADFIDHQTNPNDKIAVLAQNQGSLALTAGRTLDMSGPGMIETYIWPDATKTMQGLREHGPENLFLDPRIRGGDPYETVFSVFEPAIRTAYMAKDWEPNGRLLHLVRRKMATDRDVVPYDRPLQVSGGRGDFPLLVSKELSGKTFQLEMKVVARPVQERLAILASSTNINLEPFQGVALYHLLQMGKDQWAFAIGDGVSWKSTPQFSIPSGRPATVKISYTTPQLEIDVDDKTSFRNPSFAVLSPTTDPLYIGDWIAHMYRADVPMDLVLDTRFGSKDYWKIQDRRFNGEIISARLLP